MQMFSLEHNHEMQDNKQVQQLDQHNWPTQLFHFHTPTKVFTNEINFIV